MQAEAVETLVDKEAERAVLGAMMIEKSVIPLVIALLGHTDEAFFTTDHQLIYTAIVNVYDRVSNVDPLLVADELKRTHDINRIGGTDYLYELQATIVETESTEFYAEIVYEKVTRRQLIGASSKIRKLAQDLSKKLAEVIDESQEEIFNVGQEKSRRGFQAIRPLVRANIDAIEKLFHKQERLLGVPTGFMDFDHMTSGLQPGNFVVIAARPSMGKTTLVLNMAQNIALEQERPVAIFSLEMPAQDIAMRMLSAESHIDFGRLRTGNFSDDYWRPLTEAAGDLAEAPIFINDDRSLSVQQLRTEGRRLKNEHSDLAVIIVDYLQLLTTEDKPNVREQEISAISRALKALAGELEVPIIACSQLSREVERRPDKQPQLSDLRESGAIEQDADLVAFLYREDYYKDEDAGDRVEAHLLIKKQRNGPTGTVVLYFIKKQMRFENSV